MWSRKQARLMVREPPCFFWRHECLSNRLISKRFPERDAAARVETSSSSRAFMLMTQDSIGHLKTLCMNILLLSGGVESKWKYCSSLLSVEKMLSPRVWILLFWGWMPLEVGCIRQVTMAQNVCLCLLHLRYKNIETLIPKQLILYDFNKIKKKKKKHAEMQNLGQVGQ